MSAGWAAGLWGLSWAFSRVTAGVVGAYPRVIAGANKPLAPKTRDKKEKKKDSQPTKTEPGAKKTNQK